jgi:hypothetical protein
VPLDVLTHQAPRFGGRQRVEFDAVAFELEGMVVADPLGGTGQQAEFFDVLRG